MTPTTLTARRHTAGSGTLHLRVYPDRWDDAVCHRLHRVGTPARWLTGLNCFDYPLTPAAVVALDRAGAELGAQVVWEDGLEDFAQAHLQQAQMEHQVRLGIERIIREKLPLDPYVARTDEPPMRHQMVSYHWAQRVTGLYLAHEPGCGKTRSASDASGGWYRNGIIRPMAPAVIDGKPGVVGGVLVVCPKPVVKTWRDELLKWQNAMGLPVLGQPAKKRRLACTPAHYHIVNYQGLSYVAHNQYDAVVVDEAHYLANHTGQTEHCLKLGQRARRRLALSGTPISNSLKSIFYQMLFVDGGKTLGASRTAFLEKYFTENTRYSKGAEGKSVPVTDHTPKENAASAIAAAMAESTYFVKKEEVLDLPAKTHTPLYLEMTPEQEKYYNEMLEDSITYVQDAEVTAEQASARMMKLLQVCQGFVLGQDAQGKEVGRHFSDAKTNTLAEILQGELAGRKVIVWAYFQYEIQRLAKAMQDARVPYIRIDGTITNQAARDAAMDRWNRDSDLRIYIRQLSMSEGVTLHAKDAAIPCMDTVYMGLNYRYVDWVQSQDRVHRIGQKHPCSYRYLLTENGVDRAVYESLLGKHQLATSVAAEAKDYYLHILNRAKALT